MSKILSSFWHVITGKNKNGVPRHLWINNRSQDQAFLNSDKLFRGYTHVEYDDIADSILLEAIKFPDFSCNWSRYSDPIDIKYRKNSHPKDGCYSFTVLVSRFKSLATPVHNPLADDDYPNYSHTEVRASKITDKHKLFMPVPPRKRKMRKGGKLNYRQNLANSLIFEFRAKE